MKLLHGGFICWKCDEYIPEEDVVTKKCVDWVPYGERDVPMVSYDMLCPHCGCDFLIENESAWRGKVRAKFSELRRINFMNIYWCHEADESEGLFVLGLTRGRAKAIYAAEEGCKITDVRTNLMVRGTNEPHEGAIDEALCKKYGLEYRESEE